MSALGRLEEPTKGIVYKHANILYTGGVYFAYMGRRNPRWIASKLCLVVGIQNVIKCVKFGDDRLWGLRLAAGCQSSLFTIDFAANC